jgi:sugar lactone lactonase YvrE
MTVAARGRAARLAPAAMLLALLATPALAVAPVLWTMETFEDFERGRPDGAAVGAAGELVIAPGLRPLRIPPFDRAPEPFLWSQAVDGKGNLYVGGGNGGRIYRVPRGGQGAVYYETGDLAVHALAIDRFDVLYAATAPQGKIYRITGEGKGEVYYAPEDRYIWALAIGPAGELFAATGERGIIYRIPSRGRAETYFDSEEFHVVSLAVEPGGALLAGTDGKGLLYRITGPGRAAVVYDSRLREINEIAVDARGVIYAAALGLEGEAPVPPPPTPQPAPTAREEQREGAPVQPPVPLPGLETAPTATVTVVASAAAPGAAPTPRSEVYRIEPDGTVGVIWSSQEEVVHALLLDAAGHPILGTGEPARIRLIPAPRQSSLLARLQESQVTALTRGTDRQIYAASSNVGRVYVLDPAAGQSGTYVSPTRDAQTVARWGRISWRASIPPGGRVEVSTRSGNSGNPDGTWSPWSEPYAHPEGSPVSSPPARYLQWRARLIRAGGGTSPALQAVTLAYLPSNLPPVLRGVTVNPPGVIRERPAFAPDPDPHDLAFTGFRVGPDGSSAPGAPVSLPDKKIYVRGMRSLEWTAEDPNGDPLSFELSFRGEDETAWKPLARGLREPYFAFDSMQLPDGLYRVRVEASDAGANLPGEGKAAALASDPFVIDNTPPSVQVAVRRSGREVVIEVSATDAIGPIARAEYSLDAARWVPLAPADGVPDSRAETYSVNLGAVRAGEHTVIVKVIDLLGNVGAGKATFTAE